ncbi:MAG: hypothetical protein K5652_07105, partial [Bacteroidales bacterium]|nr:hypothetical protein [Bacteroidales bacterium]
TGGIPGAGPEQLRKASKGCEISWRSEIKRLIKVNADKLRFIDTKVAIIQDCYNGSLENQLTHLRL